MVLLIPPLTNELTKILDIWSFYICLTVPSLPLQKLYFNTKVPFLPNSIPIHCFSWMQRNFKVYTLGIRKDRCCPLPSSPNSSHFKVENWKLQIQRIQLMGLLFCLFRTAPTAYGGSQARGPIRAAATGLHQSHCNAGSKPRLQPSWQGWILNPLSEARDQTWTSWMVVRFVDHWAPMGTPEFEFLNTDLIEYFIIIKLENTSIGIYCNTEQRISTFCCHNFFFFFWSFCLFRAASTAYGRFPG